VNAQPALDVDRIRGSNGRALRQLCRWMRDERLGFVHARREAVEHRWLGIGDRWFWGKAEVVRARQLVR